MIKVYEPSLYGTVKGDAVVKHNLERAKRIRLFSVQWKAYIQLDTRFNRTVNESFSYLVPPVLTNFDQTMRMALDPHMSYLNCFYIINFLYVFPFRCMYWFSLLAEQQELENRHRNMTTIEQYFKQRIKSLVSKETVCCVGGKLKH